MAAIGHARPVPWMTWADYYRSRGGFARIKKCQAMIQYGNMTNGAVHRAGL